MNCRHIISEQEAKFLYFHNRLYVTIVMVLPYLVALYLH